jgi:hypothetical protein
MLVRNSITACILGLIICVFLAQPGQGRIIYVDDDATGANNGSNWQGAYRFLQDALADAQSGDQIFVAQGIYTPDSNSVEPDGTDDRAATFQLVNNVMIWGGYAGVGEPNSDARDVELYETVLSGDLGENDIKVTDPCHLLTEPTRTDNSYHVVTSLRAVETAMLAGFTITGGNANGPASNNSDIGGGLHNDWGYPGFVDCLITCNSASSDGGAMYNDGIGYPKLVRCTFTNNSAGNDGGAMYNDSHPDLIRCTFHGNRATRNGGAVANGFTSSSFSLCEFDSNLAEGSGGAIFYHWSGGTVAECEFKYNSATWGGGILNTKGGGPFLTNCGFLGNEADYGGGVYNYDGYDPPLVENCTFGHNTARYYGGGMLNWKSNPWLVNCTFVGNSAGWYGGAMNNIHGDNPVVLDNCLLFRNSADKSAGAISSSGSSSTFRNCTLAANTAPQGAALSCITVEDSSESHVDISNCILWDENDEILNTDNSAISIMYSNVRGGWVGEGNLNADPGFVDPDQDNYHLSEGSPSIDAGSNLVVPLAILTDLDGNPRITGNAVDTGAYESRPSSGTREDKFIYLTDFGRGLPENWTVIDGSEGQSDGLTWTSINPRNRRDRSWFGRFMIADSQWAGEVDMDEQLITPSLDCMLI